jgi:RNA polymerase sigma-70 factor (ECF subfamily)
MQIWKQASSYDPRRGAVGAWLLTVARSRALDRYRSMSARIRAEGAIEPESTPAPPDPAANAVQSQLTDRLHAALATLTPEQRQVLELAYFRGCSQSEIATRLGAPLGTVKSWTRQGLLRLREVVPKEQWT